jgi:hypothetical protein
MALSPDEEAKALLQVEEGMASLRVEDVFSAPEQQQQQQQSSSPPPIPIFSPRFAARADSAIEPTLVGMPAEIIRNILVLFFTQFVVRLKIPARPSSSSSLTPGHHAFPIFLVCAPRYHAMALFHVCRRLTELAQQVFISSVCLQIPDSETWIDIFLYPLLTPSLGAILSANLKYLEVTLEATIAVDWGSLPSSFRQLRELCIAPFTICVSGPPRGLSAEARRELYSPSQAPVLARLRAMAQATARTRAQALEIDPPDLPGNELFLLAVAVGKLKELGVARHIPIPNLLPVTHPDYARQAEEFKRRYWPAIYILQYISDLRHHAVPPQAIRHISPDSFINFPYINGYCNGYTIHLSRLQDGQPLGLPFLRRSLERARLSRLKVKLRVDVWLLNADEGTEFCCVSTHVGVVTRPPASLVGSILLTLSQEIEWDVLTEWYCGVPAGEPFVPNPQARASFDEAARRVVATSDIWVRRRG